VNEKIDCANLFKILMHSEEAWLACKHLQHDLLR